MTNSAEKFINEAASRLGEQHERRDGMRRAVQAEGIAAGMRGDLKSMGISEAEADKYDLTKIHSKLPEVSTISHPEALSIARNPDADPELLHQLALHSQHADVRQEIAANPAILSTTIDYFLDHSSDQHIFSRLSSQNKISSAQIERLWQKVESVKVPHLRGSIFSKFTSNPNTPASILKIIIDDDSYGYELTWNDKSRQANQLLGHPNLTYDLLRIIPTKEFLRRLPNIMERVKAHPNWPKQQGEMS